MASGTSFWKVLFAVLAAIILAGSCVVGGCLFLVGYGSSKVRENQSRAMATTTVLSTGWETSNGYDRVTGIVKNNGSRALTYWKVTVQFRDAAGSVIDTAFTNSLERVAPGDSKNFEILHKNDPRAEHIGLSLDEVRTE